MSGECYMEQNTEMKVNQVHMEEQPDESEMIGDARPIEQGNNMKLHEMGEALEIAENRCNTLKEQLDQMRHLYRERSNLGRSQSKEKRSPEPKPIVRQNSDAISTDNSGAAVLTINNILNGITNSINRLSELHTYMESDTKPFNVNKKSKQSANQQECDNRGDKFADRHSSSYLYNERKKEQKKRAKRLKPLYESGSLTHMKKSMGKHKPSPREDPSTTSMRGRKRSRRTPRTTKRPPLRRPGFNANVPSNNHLVEIYHNSSLDYADSEEQLTNEQLHTSESRYYSKPSHSDVKNKWNRKDIQIPVVATMNEFRDGESSTQTTNRAEGMRSLSPIKEQDYPQDQPQVPFGKFSRSYQSPTISSKMKQVARGYFRHFSCKSIPFCAAKSTSPSHNIGINIQQVMSIIKGRQSVNGISPTLAHNIGLAAERLNHESFSAMVSNMGSRYGCGFPYQYPTQMPMPCPMQYNMNYQQLQEMAAEVPAETVLEEEANTENENEKEKLQDDIEKKSNEAVSWSIDPNTQNNCTCANMPGVGFNQVIDKYQQFNNPTGNFNPVNSFYNSQPTMYSTKIQKQSMKKYKHVRSHYAQYNESSRKSKKDSLGEISIDSNNINSSLPLQGKEKILKGVLINLHEDFASLSDKYDELTKIVEEENQTNPDNIEKLEALEKKLNEKEIEIQMVMSLYTEVVNLKQQVKTLKEKAGITATLIHKQPFGDNANYQQQNFTNFSFQQQQTPQQQQQGGTPGAYPYYLHSRQRETKTNAAMHLTKLLRQIQAYQEVAKTGGK